MRVALPPWYVGLERPTGSAMAAPNLSVAVTPAWRALPTFGKAGFKISQKIATVLENTPLATPASGAAIRREEPLVGGSQLLQRAPIGGPVDANQQSLP